MMRKNGNSRETTFLKSGVTGITTADHSLSRDIEFKEIKLQRAKEYVRLLHPEMLEQGWVVINIDIFRKNNANGACIVLIRDGSVERMPVNGQYFYVKNVAAHHETLITEQRRNEKRVSKANKEAEEARRIELDKISKREQLEAQIAALTAELERV